jgi:hypothetical protein
MEDKEFNPEINPNVIVIEKQEDGNYKGWMQKYGKVIEAREIKPEDVLVKLLTNDGK